MSKVNKKMKKVAAAIAVATLSMSMSMGVFASSPIDPEIPDVEQPEKPDNNKPEKPENPDNNKPEKPENPDNNKPEEKPIPEVWGATGTDKNGNKVTARSTEEISKEVEEILKDEEKVKDILEGAGFDVKEDQNTVVLGAGNLELVDKFGNPLEEMPEGGVDLDLRLDSFTNSEDFEGLENGDTLYVLHQKADGTWEVLEGTVSVNEFGVYSVSAHFDSLSPVAVVKVMSNGKVAVLDKNEEVLGTLEPDKVAKDETSVKVVKTTTVKTSPKTGN